MFAENTCCIHPDAEAGDVFLIYGKTGGHWRAGLESDESRCHWDDNRRPGLIEPCRPVEGLGLCRPVGRLEGREMGSCHWQF